MSLFEKLGGFSAVSKIVSEFFDELLSNDSTAPYFANSNMKRLMDHQVKFISQALGGPVEYTGQTIRDAHKNLKISEKAFDEVAKILEEVLDDNDVESGDISQIMNVVGSLKNDIVSK